MFLNILILYILGLSLLFLSDFLGLCLLRFRKINMFAGVLIGYLMIISTYAIVKSSLDSIGIFVIIWILGYIFIIKKNNEAPTINKQEYLQRLLIISTLWTLIFALKVSFFWNSDYNCPNLLFIDYEFYMKIAEGYNISGHENALGLKNGLLQFLDFAQPYRSNDIWLVSLGLDLTNIDTIYIWELFYSTILIFICSLSLFAFIIKKYSLIWSLILSVLVLFAFSGTWYRDIINLFYAPNAGSYDPIGIVAYTKLAAVFSIMFHFFYLYGKEKKLEAIYFLILIPFLVQSAIAVFLLIVAIFLLCIYKDVQVSKKSFRNYIPIIGAFAFLLFCFLGFYLLNQQKEFLHLGNTDMGIVNNDGVIGFIIQFVKKSVLLLISYYWLSFFLATVLLISAQSLAKVIRWELFVILIICFFCSTIVYAKFNKMGNAYQFSTNVCGPFVLALIIYLLIEAPYNSLFGKIKLTMLIIVSFIGMKQIIGGNNVFHSTSRIQFYSPKFIRDVKNELSELDYVFGVVYYGKDLQKYPIEDFPQYDSTFLKLYGRNYDVFNIEADSLEMDYSNELNQKRNSYIKKNALNIWLHNTRITSNTVKKLGREDFYNAYPFGFCISRVSRDSLPEYIKSDVISILKDEKSKIFFYRLKREKNNFKNVDLSKRF
ncbi:hypothetical protein [Flavobacterium sp. GT3R68]|uniref:hypothetical protein n=1 Tax=Flavobacterium sp. GT3R68 TaxID=2594437 RepID=UPI000F879F2E|nr:hypothetical protein [Flavobacterium sp. GT3R68]RTY92256.1 hypothetical protein EKL32_17770 [Flavobacterium sp. GSN2]TRW92492.1 hypothetical protein FNW07_05695 [Flavobacterium sp. GT3R68]